MSNKPFSVSARSFGSPRWSVVAWQQVSIGKHRGGEVVDIHVRNRLLEVWSGNDLIRSIARDNTDPVCKRRASHPTHSDLDKHQPSANRQPSTEH
jgi:hypothetical protein